MRVFKHHKAKRDVLRIFVYIGENNLDAAERFLAAVDADLKRLGEMPKIGAMREFEDKKLAGVRSWPVSGFENYLIFYRPTETRVEVLRVIHGTRDIERAMNE